jgi:hypothetical protein
MTKEEETLLIEQWQQGKASHLIARELNQRLGFGLGAWTPMRVIVAAAELKLHRPWR